MSKKVSIDSFADELVNILQEYTTEVEEGLEKAKEDNAKNAVKVLKRTSPVGTRKRKRRYYQGWRAKKIGTAWVVHNATDYQLTHLLEKGHAKVGGGRVPGKPHIAPVEEQVIVGYEKQLEKIIRGR
ncbi:HK97 gp10 family phage protein [Oceanobacillus sp. FSL H7-0719]|uniref:HK97 gp10 family phage protein n=1 Tax=Oceanobacillus sp. FSL H7-0719 TaxID=2954507 RepID=UPI003249354A